jgi:hypothetical protein
MIARCRPRDTDRLANGINAGQHTDSHVVVHISGIAYPNKPAAGTGISTESLGFRPVLPGGSND